MIIEKVTNSIDKEEKPMILKEPIEKIEYIFELKKEEDHIHFKVKECNLYPPFTYESNFTLQDFIDRHVAFKSCLDLDEVMRHLINLYKNKKISINNLGPEGERHIYFKVWNISIETDSKTFILNKIMTEDKDKALSDLYDIQKKQIDILKNIKSKIKDNLTSENPLYKDIMAILKKCEVKI